MSNLVVITFDNVEEAGRVRETLRSIEKGDYLSLNDSAVVVKDEEGKVSVQNEVDRGVKVGAVGGGALGLLIGGIFFPFAGLLIGAVAGAVLGKMVDSGVDRKFVDDVSADLVPGSSAIFFIVRDADPDVAIAALRPYKGKIYHTSLSTEAEESLRDVLKRRR
jgi:uncharacterized membrane protein